jgi:hypothetical protein
MSELDVKLNIAHADKPTEFTKRRTRCASLADLERFVREHPSHGGGAAVELLKVTYVDRDDDDVEVGSEVEWSCMLEERTAGFAKILNVVWRPAPMEVRTAAAAAPFAISPPQTAPTPALHPTPPRVHTTTAGATFVPAIAPKASVVPEEPTFAFWTMPAAYENIEAPRARYVEEPAADTAAAPVAAARGTAAPPLPVGTEEEEVAVIAPAVTAKATGKKKESYTVVDHTCTICQGVYLDPCPLRCGHTFCRTCVRDLRRDDCPFCKAPFDRHSTLQRVITDEALKKWCRTVRVKCHAPKCQWEGPNSQYKDHVVKCRLVQQLETDARLALLAPDRPCPPPSVQSTPSPTAASSGAAAAAAASASAATTIAPNEFSSEWAMQLQATLEDGVSLAVAPRRAQLASASKSFVTFAAKHALTAFGGDARRSSFRVRIEWGLSRGACAWIGLLPAGAAPGAGDIPALGGAAVSVGPTCDMFVQGWRFHPSVQAQLRTNVPDEAEVQITLLDRGVAELAVYLPDDVNTPVSCVRLDLEGGLARAGKLLPAVSLRSRGTVITLLE